MNQIITRFFCLLLSMIIIFSACEGPEGDIGPQGTQGEKGDKGDKGDTGEDGADYPTAVQLKDYSITPALLKKLSGFENAEVYSLISSEDKLISSPSFTFAGSADGAGLLRLTDGYTLIVNHEDNFAVSRLALDKTFKPVSGEYILNSDGGQWRLCSGTLATPEEHGFGPLFLTCGESGPESRTHAVNPYASSLQAGITRELPALGRWSAENAVPLPKTAYPGKTVILIGDDDSGAAAGGQVAMYVSTTGDLEGGKLYALRRVDQNMREMDFVEDATAVDVEFVELQNDGSQTGAQINSEAAALKALAFGRVEDLDYRKDNVGREIYFNVTGQDGNADRSKYGRVYKLVLNETDPLKGTLQLVLDGDDKTSGKAKEFQNPDNIIATENYLYIQEDPNTYGDETHDAYIYQYSFSAKELKKVFELNHYRDDATMMEKFKATAAKGNWEYGAMLDISEAVGIDDVFLLCIQPHTWRYPQFAGVDGGALRPNENQGSQIVVIKGLPR